MKTLKITFFMAAFALTLQSCANQNSDSKKEPADNSSAAQQNQASTTNKGSIAIDEFKILDRDGGSGTVVLSMDKEGKCYLGTDFIGTINTTGEIKSDKEQLVAHLKGERFMTDKDKLISIIKKDGTISKGPDKEMSWGPDGILSNSGLKIVPADTKAKQAASMLLSAFFGFSVIESN